MKMNLWVRSQDKMKLVNNCNLYISNEIRNEYVIEDLNNKYLKLGTYKTKERAIKILELFGGIGACSSALTRLGIEYEISDYVEIDKYAVKSFNAIHNTNFEPQDICKWDKDIEVDLIMHGSPCQDFSLAGKQAGGDKDSGTRSSLMYETIRIVEKLKPKYVIWENVKNLLSKKHRHNFDAYLETMKQLGYTNYYQVLNAKDYGIPQNRERVFTVSIRSDIDIGFVFPEKQELKLKLKDMLEDDVDEKYYLSDKMIKYISATGTANFKNPDCKINLDIARPLTTDQNKRAGTTNYLSNNLPNNYDLSIPIKNATKKGYLEAHDGDGCYISNIDKKRGTVQKEMIPTLKTSPDIGVVVKNEIMKIDIPQTVRIRKYPVDIEKLKKSLKEHKNYTNKEIALILDRPLTLVEHWFRTDGCFSIPDENIWIKLKTLLKINTDEFDESIMIFEEREGVYDKANRFYYEEGISPTITSTSANEKIIVGGKNE